MLNLHCTKETITLSNFTIVLKLRNVSRNYLNAKVNTITFMS